MKKLTAIIAVFLLGAWIGHAQNPTSQFGSVVTGTHTACTVATSVTQICFASDGLWLSVNGAAYLPVQTAVTTGIQAIVVCDATGVTCQTANTGPSVTLKIPTKVSLTVPAPTVSQGTSSATLQ